MKNHLVFPHPPAIGPDGTPVPRHGKTRFLCNWDPNHPDGCPGFGRLLDGKRQPITADAFRAMRDKLNAYLETDEPDMIRIALGLDKEEPGVILAFRR